MTWRITIDPVELMDTAVLLGSSAVELADVGATLRTCTGCAMPPEVRNSVDHLVAVADQLFDDMALQLRAEATNLAQRAIIAANDILTAAGHPPLPGTTTTTTPGPTIASGLPMTVDGIPINPPAPSGSGLTIGGGNWGTISAAPGINFGASTIGGNSGGNFTIVNPDGTPYVAPSTMTLGGLPLNADGIPINPPGPADYIVGGGITNDSTGLLALAGASQKMQERVQTRLDRMFRSGDPMSVSFAIEGQSRLGDARSHTIAPSISELERDAGHQLTMTEVERISPHSVPFVLRPRRWPYP